LACENGAVIGTSRAVVGIVGDFSDPTNERIIYLSAAGLALLGLGLLLATIVWWRRGRQEHPALAPLEVMSARAWAKAPAGDRRRRLDRVRLTGAAANEDEPVRAAPLDLEALVRNTPQAFDDLREPGESADDVPEPTDEPAAADAEGEAEVDGEAVVAEEAAGEADAVEPVEVEPVEVEPVVVEDDAEPAKEATPIAPKPAPAAVDRDATQVSAQRPPQSVDVLASGPPDPSL
jgi:hypothetical protein